MFETITTNRLPETVQHPATGCDYFARNNRRFTKPEKQNIVSRFGNEKSPFILAALDTATHHTVNHAHHIEVQNTNRILHATSDPFGNADRYKELVADIDRIPDFIRFFSTISADVFSEKKDNESNVQDIGKIALCLLLTLQRGDWESTRLLDQTFRNLKHSIPDPMAAGYKEFNTPGDRRASYRYTRLPDHAHEPGNDVSEFGIITRRRKVADVFGVGIFKQSKGLVVLDELHDSRRKLALSTPYSVATKNGAASAIGIQFEEDIAAPKGSTRTIVPISAHYLMIAARNTHES